MDAENTALPATDDLERAKLQAETEKLHAELQELRRPWFRDRRFWGTWMPLLVIVITLLVNTITSDAGAKLAAAETKLALAQKLEAQAANAQLAIQQANLEAVVEVLELRKRSLDEQLQEVQKAVDVFNAINVTLPSEAPFRIEIEDKQVRRRSKGFLGVIGSKEWTETVRLVRYVDKKTGRRLSEDEVKELVRQWQGRMPGDER